MRYITDFIAGINSIITITMQDETEAAMEFLEGLDVELLLAEKMVGKTKFDLKVKLPPAIHICPIVLLMLL